MVDDYANCDGCGCYELENCADSEDVIYVSGDLATFLGEESGVATIGRFIKKDGVCYQITGFANPCGAEAVEWPGLVGCGFDNRVPGCPQQIESCNGCCWMLTPCPDQAGGAVVKYYRLNSSDTDLSEFVDENGVSNGRVLRLADDVCYSVDIPEDCPEEDVILGLGTVKEEYDSCEDCIVSCWERCDAAGTFLKTFSDMKEVGPNAVAKRAEDGFCYKRATLSECDGDELPPTVDVSSSGWSNDNCNAPGDCADFNGSHTITYTGSGGSPPVCQFSHRIPGSEDCTGLVGGDLIIAVTISHVGGMTRFRVLFQTLKGTGVGVFYSLTQSTSLTCRGVFVLPFEAESGGHDDCHFPPFVTLTI